MSLYKTILCFLLAQAVFAVPSNVARHHAIAARMPVPQAKVLDLPVVKRSTNRRCRQRNSTTNSQASTTTSKAATTSVPVVGNVGSDPTTHAPSTTSHSPSPPPPPPKTTTSKAAESTHSSGGSANLPSFMIGTQTGEGTYYDTGLTACGVTNNNGDLIVAVSHLLFDNFPNYDGSNPNNNPVCGRKIRATYKGNSVTVTVTDRCTACAETDLDFTPTALSILDPNYETDGRIYGVKWTWA